jgi:nucleoside-diphosphate-sugar epimerase
VSDGFERSSDSTAQWLEEDHLVSPDRDQAAGHPSVSLREERVFITGAHGFVGAHLVRALPAVRTLDRARHSLFEEASLKSELESCSVVVHLAGVNAGSGFQPSARELTQHNILGTLGILKAIRKYCRRPPLFVLLSSVHVYDNAQPVFTETSVVGPSSIYGFSKLAQENLAELAAVSGSVRAVVFRTSNVYGPGCRPDYNSAVATMCERLSRGDEIPLYANGNAQVDLIFVDDVVETVIRAVSFAKSAYNVYNLASGRTVTVDKVLSILERVSGIQAKKVLVDVAAPSFKVSIDRLLNVGGLPKQVDLETGLLAAWEGRVG